MSANNPLSNIPPLGTPSGMMQPAGASRFRQIDPLRVIRTYIVLLIAALVVGVVLGAGAWFVTDRMLSKHTSEAALSVSPSLQQVDAASSAAEAEIKDLEPTILTEVNVIRSQEILDDLLKQPAIRTQTEWFTQFDGDLEEAREALEEQTLRANHIRDTTLIRVSATTANPTDAQTIVSELIRVYLLEVESRAASRYNKDRVAFQRQLEAVIAQIDTVKAQMRRHLLDHPRASMDQRHDITTQELLFLNAKKSEIGELLAGAQANQQQLQERLERGDFAPSDDEVQIINAAFSIQQIDAQIRQLRVARQTRMDSGLGDSHALIQQIDSEIRHQEVSRDEEFDRQARILFNAKVEIASQTVGIFEDQLRTFEPRILELQAQLEDLQRALTDFQTMQRELEQLELQREDARQVLRDLDLLIRRAGSITVEMRSPASTAKKTFPPHPAVMVPGIAILFVGLVTGLVFLRELLDQRVKAAADIKSIGDTALLGIIPNAGEDPSGKVPAERVVEQQPIGLLAESYRQVRSAVLSKMDRRGYKTLAVAAAKPGAGTTCIVQNLGASMALSGRRVLIIDANFRRPSQAALCNVPDGPGLVDILRGEVAGDPVAGCVHTLDNLSLSVLPVGDSEQAAPELLESPAFRELLGQLEASFDIILIDAPPALLTSEAQLLCKHVDALILVSRARSDTRGMVQRMIGQLDGQRADILGVVLNDVLAAAGGYLRQNFQEFDRYRNRDGKAHNRQRPTTRDAGRKAASANGSPPASERAIDTADETVIVDALQDRDELDDLDEFDEDRN